MNIIIVDCFDTWEHRVDLLYKMLSEDGYKVKCLLSDYRHFEKVKRDDKKKDFLFFHADPYKRNISPRRLISHIKLSKNIFDFIEKHNDTIDILWVLAPPNVFIRDATKIKKAHPRIKLIIDLIDLWPEAMPVGKIKPVFFLWKMLRDRYIRLADTVVTECKLYQEVLGKVLKGLDVQTLYLAREDNGYEPDLHLPDDKIAICYLGSINNIIDIEGIKRAIKELGKVKPVILHIIGDGEKKDELVKNVESVGADIVDHGTVYERREKQQIFDSCHCGLNMMKDSVCVGLTMKSIDYFEFGLPIINNIKGDTWDIVEAYDCGINVGEGPISVPSMEMRKAARGFFEEELTEDVFKGKVAQIVGGR